MGRGNHTGAERAGRFCAEPIEAAFLDQPEELRLQRQRHVTDLSRKSVPLLVQDQDLAAFNGIVDQSGGGNILHRNPHRLEHRSC